MNIVYSESMTLSLSNGSHFIITVTDDNFFTVNAPLLPLTRYPITITIRNVSGSDLGEVKWDAVFKLSAWTQPKDGNSRSITFFYDGTNWIEQNRTPADVPN